MLRSACHRRHALIGHDSDGSDYRHEPSVFQLLKSRPGQAFAYRALALALSEADHSASRVHTFCYN